MRFTCTGGTIAGNGKISHNLITPGNNQLYIYIYITLSVVVLLSGSLFFWRWIIRRCEQACRADWGIVWLNRLDGLNRIFCRSFHKLRHDPMALRPDSGVLIASNHVSGLDPLLLVAACDRPLRFVIAREQYERWWLRWLFKAMGCIPVDRGKNPRSAFRVALEALHDGEVVAIFPHGRIHLSHQPPARLKRGVALLAQLASVPVLPLRIEGVRGQGMTVAAVLIPSRARITIFERIHFGKDIYVGMQRLAERIGGIAAAPE
ncbi:MAG: hypothetical protein BMS9Abin11_1032 [Gammaproteobacteria bacterium]|nr:MAG: hypothetical protein BMS9Abin11_1032 [Gammaproteobacteria bacterium]